MVQERFISSDEIWFKIPEPVWNTCNQIHEGLTKHFEDVSVIPHVDYRDSKFSYSISVYSSKFVGLKNDERINLVNQVLPKELNGPVYFVDLMTPFEEEQRGRASQKAWEEEVAWEKTINFTTKLRDVEGIYEEGLMLEDLQLKLGDLSVSPTNN